MRENTIIRLLVVDEHEDYCDLLKEQLELSSYSLNVACQFVHCGEHALQTIAKWRPTVVLLDAHLEDIDSFEVLDACREGRATVVVASDATSGAVEKRARELGASGFFSKSENPDVISALIAELANVSLPVLVSH